MILTQAIIRATANVYTRAALEDKLRQALEALERGSQLVEVQSGAGTAYKRQVFATPAEAVELYQSALDLQAGDVHADDVTQSVIVGSAGMTVC